MSPAKYAKAIVAFLGSAAAWIMANVQITDDAIVIPLTPEAAGMLAGVMAIVYGVYRIPNKDDAAG